ncbi:MAG: outer membrane beta-barrel protein [Cyanobacteria bacterium P01_G01_bin.19]
MKTLATTAVFAALVLNFPTNAYAQEINLENRSENLPTRLETSELFQADARNRESREPRTSTKSKGISGYAGATLGILFPDVDEDSGIFTGNDTDVNNGFGGSLFGGVKFNRYLATDLELSTFSGDIDSDLDVDDESYTISSIMLNPRFILPLNDKDNSLDLFLSPGLGISNLRSRVEDEVEDFDRTTVIEDDTRFTWQVKGGASVPVSSKFSVLGQLRYASQTGDDAIDYFTTELGVEFDF